MKVLMIQGSNMILQGIRNPEIYGRTTVDELDAMMRKHAEKMGISLEIFYTNSEGDCIDRLIKAYHDAVDAIVMNPGGFSYTSYAIRDTLKGIRIPYVEIHLSNHYERGIHSVIAPAAQGVIMGLGIHVYLMGIDAAMHLASQQD